MNTCWIMCAVLSLALSTAQAAQAAQVTLTWQHTPTATQPDVATGFQVLACQGVGCPPADLPGAVTSGTVLTYVHTGLAPNAIYCYEVVALNGPSRSAPSNKACGGLFAPPSAPSSLTLTFQP